MLEGRDGYLELTDKGVGRCQFDIISAQFAVCTGGNDDVIFAVRRNADQSNTGRRRGMNNGRV